MEGTTADITCNGNCVLSGHAQLVCQGGHWYRPGGKEVEEPPEDPLAAIDPDRYMPICTCPQEEEQQQEEQQQEEQKEEKKKEKKKKEKKKKKKKNGKRGAE